MPPALNTLTLNTLRGGGCDESRGLSCEGDTARTATPPDVAGSARRAGLLPRYGEQPSLQAHIELISH